LSLIHIEKCGSIEAASVSILTLEGLIHIEKCGSIEAMNSVGFNGLLRGCLVSSTLKNVAPLKRGSYNAEPLDPGASHPH
jgi:hypothetical protein